MPNKLFNLRRVLQCWKLFYACLKQYTSGVVMSKVKKAEEAKKKKAYYYKKKEKKAKEVKK
jgi:hypothetical protein